MFWLVIDDLIDFFISFSPTDSDQTSTKANGHAVAEMPCDKVCAVFSIAFIHQSINIKEKLTKN